MAQLRDDCFAQGGELLSADAALSLLAERVHPITTAETAPLSAALGRILARDIVAERDVPPHDNSAVDGYAVYFDDLLAGRETRLPIAGRAAAGHPLSSAGARGAAIRIFTGAPMPAGPDTIMMQEDCRIDGDDVVIQPGIARGANCRQRGEDVAKGETVLHAGRRLRPQDIGVTASLGRAELSVFRPLDVAVFSTGDEVFDPGTTNLPAGGVYDSNRYCLMALLQGLGCRPTDLGILPDAPGPIGNALSTAAGAHDVIISSGGISTGEEDHVRAAVQALGQLHFWRLAIKPGRPVAMGQVAGTPFFGLPGNPVAMMVTFLRLARPAILGLAGATELEPHLYRVRAGFDYTKRANRREYVRARLARDPDGIWRAAKFARDGAGILESMVAADGLVELREGVTHIESGTMVDFLPFSEVLA